MASTASRYQADATAGLPIVDADNTGHEFRLFFPVLKDNDFSVRSSDSSSDEQAYADALAALSAAFDSLDASASKDRGGSVRMVYIVGCDHWGAKHRGEKKKLEVKYRTHLTPLGYVKAAAEAPASDSSPSPWSSSWGCGMLEAFKKKDYGKKSMSEMSGKISEKLFKHCAGEHTEELAVASARAMEAQVLCSMTKWRKHGFNTAREDDATWGPVCAGKAALVEFASLQVDPVRIQADSSAAGVGEGERCSTPDTASAIASGVRKWVSIAVEGGVNEIKHCVARSFGLVTRALRAGLQVDADMMICGYPTFVVNEALVAHATAGSSVVGARYLQECQSKLAQRQDKQRLQIHAFLAFVDAIVLAQTEDEPSSSLIT